MRLIAQFSGHGWYFPNQRQLLPDIYGPVYLQPDGIHGYIQPNRVDWYLRPLFYYRASGAGVFLDNQTEAPFLVPDLNNHP